jgi:predicted NBD/HSP70 family sugar kinase
MNVSPQQSEQANRVIGDQGLMRGLNRALVLRLLRREGRVSRADLSKHSGISRSTISSIVADLLAEGLVRDLGEGASKGGRRPIMLEFNYQSKYVIGVELGTTAMTAVVTDLEATVVHRRRLDFAVEEGPERGLAVLECLLRDLLAMSPTPGGICGVGIALPSPVLYAEGRTVAPPGMQGWDRVPLRDYLSAAIGLPVALDNDANLGALAEWRWGAGQNARNLVYIYLAHTGIGGALMFGGTLYRGAMGSAGEIGHVVVEEGGPLCRCGNRGCLEAVASVPRLLRQAREADLIGPEGTLGEFLALAPHSAPARRLLVRVGERLGMAIGGLINLANPDRVVVGGPLADAGELLLGPLRETALRAALAIAVRQVAIAQAALGPDVVALGAAALATEQLFVPAALERPEALGVVID